MDEKTIKNLFYILVVIVVGLSFLGVPSEIINFVIKIFIKYIILGAISSLVVGRLIEAFSGDILKKIFINLEIKGIKISVSAFVITVLILKLFIFH